MLIATRSFRTFLNFLAFYLLDIALDHLDDAREIEPVMT